MLTWELSSGGIKCELEIQVLFLYQNSCQNDKKSLCSFTSYLKIGGEPCPACCVPPPPGHSSSHSCPCCTQHTRYPMFPSVLYVSTEDIKSVHIFIINWGTEKFRSHGNCFDTVYNRRKMCCFSQLRTTVDISFLVVVTKAFVAVLPGGNYLHTPMLFRRGNEGKCQCSIPRGEKLGHIASVVR